MNYLFLIVATLVMALVYGYPTHDESMEGGPMNMTGDEPPMGNWTHGGPHHNMTGEHPMGHMNKGDSREVKHEDRKRRGASEDVQKAGNDALTEVEGVGKSAWDKAGELGKEGMSAIGDAGNAVKTQATGLVDKVKEAI